MRFRHLLLLIGTLFLALSVGAAFSRGVLPNFPQDFIVLGLWVFCCTLVCWTALEIAQFWTRNVSAKRPPVCGHCSYPLVGMRCPECGKVVGGE